MKLRRERSGRASGRLHAPALAGLALAGLLISGCAPQSVYSAPAPSGAPAGSASGAPSSASASGSASGAATPGASASSAASADAPASITISGSLSGGFLLTTSPVHVTVSGGKLTGITVTGPGQASVAGTVSTSAGTWTPAQSLASGTSYRVTVNAANAAGKSTTVEKTFTTLGAASSVVIAGVTPSSGHSVGDAQPMAVQFTAPVTDKAAVEKALVISDTHHVAGAWRWLSDTRIDYRPKDFWPLGDRVTLTANLAGVGGSGTYTSSFTVTSNVHAVVDAAKHTVTVWQGNRVVRSMKTGTGMPQFATWNGAMVVLQKVPEVRMTSCSIGLSCKPGTPNYYDLKVYKDVQLTPSGTYVHAAPWDTQLGVANTSHGCIHLSNTDAAWFYSHVQEGDLVTVTHAGHEVPITNGEGDWNLSWSQWTS